jgi:hypothetical protein
MLNNETFFDIVIKALKAREPFSTVRMSDGEHKIINWARTPGLNPATLIDNALFDAGWHKRFGTKGIRADKILDRLETAFNNCTYFCPGDSIHYRFPPHKNELVDNSYHYEWTRAQRTELLKTAGRVFVVNRDWTVYDKIYSTAPDVKMYFVALDNWTQTSDVIETLLEEDAPLVLLSGGPASKHLAPIVSQMSKIPKMVLDIGQGADAWWMATGREVGL